MFLDVDYPENYDWLPQKKKDAILKYLDKETKEGLKILDSPYIKSDKVRYDMYQDHWDKKIDTFCIFLEDVLGIYVSYNDFQDNSWHLITEKMADEYAAKLYD